MNKLQYLFDDKINIEGNKISIVQTQVNEINQIQTKEIFSEKWVKFNKEDNRDKLYEFQKNWFLTLYGFSSEDDLRKYLANKKTILDAGCGLGYKAAWFAELAPHATVIGVDISEAVIIAAENYKYLPNLYFHQSDIAKTKIKQNIIDFVVCDQVIMHTENPKLTFSHLSRITSLEGEFSCYVYREKALPRELLDDYFRLATHDIPNEQLWEMSAQLTELGKRLSQLKVTIDCPDIPLLGIKGGTYDLQRFFYWNFIKCFWREDWGKELCDSTNFDWYAPSNAKRFSKKEFKTLILENFMKIIHFHEEEACFSSRLMKSSSLIQKD